MDEERLADAGKLVLRLTVAGLLLFHGVHKALYGLGDVKEALAEKGVPLFCAYGVYVGELAAPLLVLAGWMSRPAALILAFNMVVAIAIEHMGDIARIGKSGGWRIELQLLFLLGGVAVALLGPGRFSVSRARGRLG
jgi:putative oxidoreductase